MSKTYSDTDGMKFSLNDVICISSNIKKQGEWQGKATGYKLGLVVTDAQYDELMNSARQVAINNRDKAILDDSKFAYAAEVRSQFCRNDAGKVISPSRLLGGKPAMKADKVTFDDGKMLITIKLPSKNVNINYNGMIIPTQQLSTGFHLGTVDPNTGKWVNVRDISTYLTDRELAGHRVNINGWVNFFAGNESINAGISVKAFNVVDLGSVGNYINPEDDFEAYFNSFANNTPAPTLAQQAATAPAAFQPVQNPAPQQVPQPAPQMPQQPQMPQMPQMPQQGVPMQNVQQSPLPFTFDGQAAPQQVPQPAPSQAPAGYPQQGVPMQNVQQNFQGGYPGGPYEL